MTYFNNIDCRNRNVLGFQRNIQGTVKDFLSLRSVPLDVHVYMCVCRFVWLVCFKQHKQTVLWNVKWSNYTQTSHKLHLCICVIALHKLFQFVLKRFSVHFSMHSFFLQQMALDFLEESKCRWLNWCFRFSCTDAIWSLGIHCTPEPSMCVQGEKALPVAFPWASCETLEKMKK